MQGVQRRLPLSCAKQEGEHDAPEVNWEIGVALGIPELIADAVEKTADEFPVLAPRVAPHTAPTERAVAQVRHARQNLENLILVRDVRPLLVVDDGVVPRRLRMHVHAVTLAGSQPQREIQVKPRVCVRRAFMVPLVKEHPRSLVVLLPTERARRGPHSQGAKVATQGDRVDLEESERHATVRSSAATDVKHDSAERVILVVLGVHCEAFVHDVVGNRRPLKHCRNESGSGFVIGVGAEHGGNNQRVFGQRPWCHS
mmetsp:Transcript_34548/g.95150  ORF Transcript_34548/g.95150 Transcript_34548/m.95150 type:complete len:256 (-) Transcript_34548:2-769(-)